MATSIEQEVDGDIGVQPIPQEFCDSAADHEPEV